MSTKRDDIIDSTCQLMELQGYHATGLNQILTESGAPKGSLYYYFPDGKEELAVEALERSGAMIAERIAMTIDESEDGVTAVTSFIRRLATYVEASGFRQGGPITAVALEVASTNDRLREACHTAYVSWQELFADKLEAEHGEPRAQRLAALIIAALEGGIILSRSARSVQPLLDVADELETVLSCADADNRQSSLV